MRRCRRGACPRAEALEQGDHETEDIFLERERLAHAPDLPLIAFSTAQPETPAPAEPAEPDVPEGTHDGEKLRAFCPALSPWNEGDRNFEETAAPGHGSGHQFWRQKRAVALESERLGHCRWIEVDVLEVVEVHPVEDSDEVVIP